MRMIRRPVGRGYSQWHPHVAATTNQGRVLALGGLTLAPLYGPAGLVGPVGSTDHPYQGMDPSDPITWTRPYNPQPGMISYLNIDGAQPNPAGGVQRGRQPFLFWRGGVAGSSVDNG
jgi:hypothetical protein